MFEKGTLVEYVTETDSTRGLRGTVASDGVNESGLVVVQWQSPTDRTVSWSLLEDARDLRPVAVAAA